MIRERLALDFIVQDENEFFEGEENVRKMEQEDQCVEVSDEYR